MWTTSSSASRPLTPSACSSSYSTINSSNDATLPITMEEVWKDISLASDLPHHTATRGVILQDFFSKDPSPTTDPSPGFASSAVPPPPPTMLTLSSAPNHFGSLLLQPHNHHSISNVSSLNVPFEALVPDENADLGRKRSLHSDRSSGDRRHKRMIKNRESAARSRARKQAYTNELELEVTHLLEENARLKEQQQKLYRAAAAQNEKKKPLHRTSTAPF